jgi:glycosyltransferase involved in cell wall biosynthesis
MSDERAVELSIVVPVFNEQGSLEGLYEEILQAISGKYDSEIIFVDDGSTDNSLDILTGFQQDDDRVRVIRFRSNFGQTAALSAGFEHSRGRIIIPLDADGQNDPGDIPKLVEKLDEGYDIVSGWRKKRHDGILKRKLPSWVANWLIARITGVKLHDFGCTLKAYRAESLKEINLYGEMHRFIPVLGSWSGEKVAEMIVNHRPRTTGATKYGLGRTIKVVLDLVTIKFLMSFSTKPIYVFGGLGVLSGMGAVLSGFVVLYQKFLSASHLSMNRNPLLVLTAMLITASIQFILMGLLAELLVRTYHESQGRKIYMIEKILESKKQENEA